MVGWSILHHGAVRGVTGSCHELRLTDDYGVLVDCGLFQGAETSGAGAASNNLEIDFPIGHIKALIVTHVHIDHVGRIPYLLAAGFDGPILSSHPSAHLLPLVLEDAVKLGFSRDPELVQRFLGVLKERVIALPYGQWYSLLDAPSQTLRVRLQRAGHILGSAYVECEVFVKKKRGQSPTLPGSDPGGTTLSESTPRGRHLIVFSGDLGAPYAPLLPAPTPPRRCDTLVIESTYGDRVHPDRRARRAVLKQVIERALENSGVVLVPAFSIGRTQELVYELEAIIAGVGASLSRLPIIVDSPLASRFTHVYRQLKPYWDIEAHTLLQRGRDPLDFDQLVTVGSHREHQRLLTRLQKTHEPCVVIAASGMCTGGRVVNYLKALLGDARTDVLFVGYQARGTPGRSLVEGAATVTLDGERFSVKAKIHQIGGYSAHADQRDLVRFATRMAKPPREVRIIHGDGGAKAELKQHLQARLPGARVWIPDK